MRRMIVGSVLAIAWACGDGPVVHDLARDVATHEDAGADALDGAPEPDIVPDPGSAPDSAPDAAEAAEPDVTDAPDIVPPPDPLAPFEPCTMEAPCLDPHAPYCLFGPGAEIGVCVKQCSLADGSSCPPWLECAKAGLGPADPAVCFRLARLDEPCSPETGVTCSAGLSCVAAPGTGVKVCTRFCDENGAACHEGATCQMVVSKDPAAKWGACLRKPDLVPCGTGDVCQEEGHACVVLGSGITACAPKCTVPEAPCEPDGICQWLAVPGGGFTGVCVLVRGHGETCSPSKGMKCKDGLHCTDLGAPDGFRRCVQLCTAGPCPQGTGCMKLPTTVAQMCIPYELSLESAVQCNEAYPCTIGGTVCVVAPGAGTGYCAEPCGAGGKCPGDTKCHLSGCVFLAPPGAPCIETEGLFCDPAADCLKDAPGDVTGYCATPCTIGGAPCEAGTSCVATLPPEERHCLANAGLYMAVCSLDEGAGCNDGLGLFCVHLSADLDFGFCTTKCTNPGPLCPAGPKMSVSTCTLEQGEAWYCAVPCGEKGECPEGMSCTGMDVCTP